MTDNIEQRLKEILKKKQEIRCQIWYKIRELEKLKTWNVKNSPLEQCLYQCNGYNNQCKDYCPQVKSPAFEEDVEERR